MAGFLNGLFSEEKRELNKLEKMADKVLALEPGISKLSDDELKNKTVEFRDRLENGETTEDILYEAFAVAREAAYRVINEKPYKVQIMGSLAMNLGDIAEMKTGEGKTLTATMAVYLNALEGKGVHVITVNEYLAGRDAAWMGKVYTQLGLTWGVVYPYQPDIDDLRRSGRQFPPNYLHDSWMDYLYWDSVLEP